MLKAKSQVTRFPAASAEEALRHFQGRLSCETDCWDVHHAIENRVVNFVLLDVRSPELFAQGRVPTAVNLPHPHLSLKTLPHLNDDWIYVVYCAGPHCNGAHKAAAKIAALGLPVKEMSGGVEGWKDEGFELVKT